MNYFCTLFEILILLLLCQLIGRRLIDLLPQSMRESIGFYLSPILGLAILVLYTAYFGRFLPFRFDYTLLSAIIMLLVAGFYEKDFKLMLKDWLQICVFATICSLPVLAPIIRYHGYNPFTDIFTYIAQAQWLQSHAFSEKVIASGHYPALTQIVLYQNSGSRMGGSFLLAYIQALFHLEWSYSAYIQTISLAFVTGCLALGGIVRQVVAVNKLVILALAAITCFSMNGFVFGAEWGFYPQTLGLAFATGIAALFPLLTQFIVEVKDYSWRNTAFYTIPPAVCSAALLLAYNEPFPIFAIGLLLFIGISALTFKQKIKSLLAFVSLYAVEVVLLVNYECLRIAKNLLQTISISKGVAIGWPVLWSPMQFLAHGFGMKSPFNVDFHHIDSITSKLLFPIVLFVLLLVIFKFLKKQQNNSYLTIIFLLCVNFALLAFFVKFRYFSPNASIGETGFTFLQFKLCKYATPFSLALLAIAAALLWKEYKSYRIFFGIIYLAAFYIGLFLHYTFVTQAFTQNFADEAQRNKYPFKTFLELRSSLATIPKDEVIHVALGAQHNKLRQMVAYILYDRKISSDYTDDGYILGHLPESDQVMSATNATALVTIKPKNNECGQKYRVVGPFAIHKAPVNAILLDKYKGGYNTELNASSGETWNWVENSISYYYSTIGSSHAVKFVFKLVSFPHPRTFTIEVKNAMGTVLSSYKLHVKQDEQIVKTPWIKVNSEKLLLMVKADGNPTRISKGDARKVKFCIANLEACTK
ncbi:MAG: hypothetical protein A3F18_05205 [Legionellales bacterium RIFCSPHIGHO2_12_FULL_37_14]|nr:MAG: hypothetical protein A3F18_05205 [Legionellales bacterium RIFCSPHIGHO2_12_FULL_37_14]